MQGIDIEIPSPLVEQAARWDSLKRWERRELARNLRAFGLSYREIAMIVPAHKGSLSAWCRDVPLTQAQRTRLLDRSGGKPGSHKGARTNHDRRAAQIDLIKNKASVEAAWRAMSDPLWLAGTMLYWGEGSKKSVLCVTNSDPNMIRLMMSWFRKSLNLDDDRFILRMHLHSGQNEEESMRFWSQITGLPISCFGKTYWKQEGTGHRKNVLYRGTLQVVVRRSGDLLHRVMGWIESCYHLGPRAASSIGRAGAS